MESFFRHLAWGQTSSEVTREYVRIPLLASIASGNRQIAKAIEELEQLDLAALSTLIAQAGYIETVDLNKFREPFDNASTILKEIHQQIDMESASWWAYYPCPDRWPEKHRESLELYKGTPSSS
jgi:hypothetical protein